MCIDPVKEKFKSFGWYTQEIDGHDMKQIIAALQRAKKIKGQPTAIIARTTKGKGVSFMENNVGFHGKAPNKDEFKRAMKELEGVKP
jgi:transketolase